MQWKTNYINTKALPAQWTYCQYSHFLRKFPKEGSIFIAYIIQSSKDLCFSLYSPDPLSNEDSLMRRVVYMHECIILSNSNINQIYDPFVSVI